MFSPISISLSPNVTWKDILIILSYLLCPWKWFSWRKGKYEERVSQRLREYLGAKHALVFDSGRSGLFALLRCLNLEPGAEVLLSAYTCIVVPNPIIWNQLEPVYVDIEKQTYNMNPADLKNRITERSRVLIIQHTFGKPAKIDELLEIAREHHLVVIEDCAHALGTEYKGKKVGIFGDAAIFSFGRDKCISCVYGGAVIIQNDAFFEKIHTYHKNLSYPKRTRIFQHLMQPIVFVLALPVYNLLHLGKIMIVVAQKLKIISKVFVSGEKQGICPRLHPAKLPNSLAEIAYHQLSLIDIFNKHRICLAQLYGKKLRDVKQLKLPACTSTEICTYLRYSLQTKDSQKIIQAAKKKNILLGDWYDTPIAPKDASKNAAHYKEGSCAVTEEVAEMTVNLPTHKGIRDDDVERIVEIFRENF